jgi:hypothetical protein
MLHERDCPLHQYQDSTSSGEPRLLSTVYSGVYVCMYKRTEGALKAILSPFWHFKTVFPLKGTIKYTKFFNSIFYAYGRPMQQCEPLLDFQSRGPLHIYMSSAFLMPFRKYFRKVIFFISVSDTSRFFGLREKCRIRP